MADNYDTDASVYAVLNRTETGVCTVVSMCCMLQTRGMLAVT